MATYLFANNASTVLAGPISNTATTCNLAAGSGVLFPQPGVGQFFAMTLISAANPTTVREIVYVTNVTNDTLTIVRAQENTTALTWNAGDMAAALVTAGGLSAFAQSANLASSFFQGTDNGSDPNNVVVPSTTPTNNGPSAGQIFIITKGPQANTGAVTLKIPSAGTQSSLVYADGTAMASGDWPGNSGMIVRFTGGLYQIMGRLLRPTDNSLLHVGTATTGTATALATTLSPLPSAFGAGLCMRVPITTTNGANATLNFGAGPVNLVLNTSGAAVVGGEMPGGVGYETDIYYDGTNARLLNPKPTPAFSSSIQYITSTTTVTVPAGVSKMKSRIWGGGGGGGGIGNSGVNGGAGGAGGGYSEKTSAVVPGQSIVVTIGAGGAAGGAPGAGGSGGTTSVGALHSATGGGGGQGSNGGGAGARNFNGGTGMGGDINISGSAGGGAFFGASPGSGGNCIGGVGGGTIWAPATDSAQNNAGVNGYFPGGGGGGGSGGNTTFAAGGTGSPGLAILEFA